MQPEIKNLNKAIEKAEEVLKKLEDSNSSRKKNKYKRVNRALENAYALLNKGEYTQKEVNLKEDDIWKALEDEKNAFLILFFIFGFLLCVVTAFSVYEAYSFFKTTINNRYDDYNEYFPVESGSAGKPGQNESKKPSDSSNNDSYDNSNESYNEDDNSNNSESDDLDSSAESTTRPNTDSSSNVITEEDILTQDMVKLIEIKYIETNIRNLNNLSSVSDQDGLKSNPLEFTIRNDGTKLPTLNYKVNYVININELNTNGSKIIGKNYIKYQVTRIENGKEYVGNIGTFGDLPVNPDGSLKLYSGSQKKNGVTDFKIKIWISAHADNSLLNSKYAFIFSPVAGIQKI